MIGRTAAALVGLLVLTACARNGGSGGTSGGGDSAGPFEPGELVLQMEWTGGFVTPQMLAGRLPIVSVYGDGRVITEGPVPAIYPGPALPNVQVTRIDEAEVQALVDRALDAGVGDTADLGSPPIADAASTRFTVSTGLETLVREVYALTEGEGMDAGLSPDQVSARAKLSDFLAELTDLSAGASAAYEPAAVAALVSPYVPPEEPELGQPDAAWPGPPLPGEAFEPMLDITCIVATGDAVPAVLQAAGSANQLTPWLAPDGSRWSLSLRPLLPHETGCADLRQA